MRIATWNLARPRVSGQRTAALRTHMAAVQADIWVLTESRISLAPDLTFELVASSDVAVDLEPGEVWTSIWASRDIKAEHIRSADPERTACMKMTDVSGRPLYIYGTVLPWLGDRRRHQLEGKDPFATVLAEQAADWRQMRAAEPDAGLCVAGDLNQDLLDSGHYYGSASRRRALRETLGEVGLACLTGGAIDPVARLGGGRACIDHICIGGSLLDVERSQEVTVWPIHEAVGRHLSDHHGVAVDIGPGIRSV